MIHAQHIVKCGRCGRHYNTRDDHDCEKTTKQPDRDRQTKPSRDREARPDRNRDLD